MPNSFKTRVQKHEKFFGLGASAFATLLSLSLIEILISNFQHRSDIVIQPLVTVINGMFWTADGISKNDKFMITLNVISVVIGVLTVISASRSFNAKVTS